MVGQLGPKWPKKSKYSRSTFTQSEESGFEMQWPFLEVMWPKIEIPKSGLLKWQSGLQWPFQSHFSPIGSGYSGYIWTFWVIWVLIDPPYAGNGQKLANKVIFLKFKMAILAKNGT